MAELASAYPTAGGLYFWAFRLGGRGWAWVTAWLNMIGQVTITAGINDGFEKITLKTKTGGEGVWTALITDTAKEFGVDEKTLERQDTPEQRDSWNRTWAFFEWHLRPYLTAPAETSARVP